MQRVVLTLGDEELESLIPEWPSTSKQKYETFGDLNTVPLTLARHIRVRPDFEATTKSAFPAVLSGKIPFSVYRVIMSFFDERSLRACEATSRDMKEMVRMQGKECRTYQVDPDSVVASMRSRTATGVVDSDKRVVNITEDLHVLVEDSFEVGEESPEEKDETCNPTPEAGDSSKAVGFAVLLLILDALLMYTFSSLLVRFLLSGVCLTAAAYIFPWHICPRLRQSDVEAVSVDMSLPMPSDLEHTPSSPLLSYRSPMPHQLTEELV